jgi:hypothetical protein
MSVPNHPALASRSYKVARQLSHFRLFQPWARQHRAAELNTEASEVFREGACIIEVAAERRRAFPKRGELVIENSANQAAFSSNRARDDPRW